MRGSVWGSPSHTPVQLPLILPGTVDQEQHKQCHDNITEDLIQMEDILHELPETPKRENNFQRVIGHARCANEEATPMIVKIAIHVMQCICAPLAGRLRGLDVCCCVHHRSTHEHGGHPRTLPSMGVTTLHTSMQLAKAGTMRPTMGLADLSHSRTLSYRLRKYSIHHCTPSVLLPLSHWVLCKQGFVVLPLSFFFNFFYFFFQKKRNKRTE